jgi:hypothetical protein
MGTQGEAFGRRLGCISNHVPCCCFKATLSDTPVVVGLSLLFHQKFRVIDSLILALLTACIGSLQV